MEAVAKLKNYPTSPRKMRLLADLIRGKNVENALALLEHNPKHPAVPLRKLVLSAINNWKQKNEGEDESMLVVKTIYVDGARTLKRMRPAPQGRGYRVRKRSNHVTLIVDVKNLPMINEPEPELVEELDKAVEKEVKEQSEKKTRRTTAKKTTVAKKTTTKKRTTKTKK
jgi:large subunit ribosomal protein L22